MAGNVTTPRTLTGAPAQDAPLSNGTPPKATEGRKLDVGDEAVRGVVQATEAAKGRWMDWSGKPQPTVGAQKPLLPEVTSDERGAGLKRQLAESLQRAANNRTGPAASAAVGTNGLGWSDLSRDDQKKLKSAARAYAVEGLIPPGLP